MSRLFLSCAALAAFVSIAPATVHAETNTNQCVTDLGAIQVCQDRNFLGLPNDLGACCDGVRKLATDRCECSPALDVVLGDEGQQIYELEPLCRLVQPLQWWNVRLRLLRSCSSLQTHDYGCGQTDMQVDAERLENIMSIQAAFTGSTDEAMCLDTPAFVEQLGGVFTPDIAVTVPYGIGTYQGLHDVAEYLGMAFAGLNHGFWLHDLTADPSKKGRLDVSADGKEWHTGSTSKGSFVRDRLPYTDLYLENAIRFEGCSALASNYAVQPTEGLRFVIERIVQASDLSQRWGLEDICRYHTMFCAGNPETQQYASEEECLEYLGGLPLYTEACGPNRPLSGHSIGCKLKHHFMIPANPQLHCPHIGRLGSHDPNHKLKCDDVAECSTDQGQASWPPVLAVGANTPADAVNAYLQSNVGYESEPMGCAIPSGETGHHH